MSRSALLRLLALALAAAIAGGAIALAQPPRSSGPAPAPVPAGAEWRTAVAANGPESAPVVSENGARWIAAEDLARLLDAAKFWHGDLMKLELRARNHRLVLTVDNPFVVIDDRTVRIVPAVRSKAGELWVPAALVDSLPRDTTLARLYDDQARQVVLQVPAAGLVTGPRLAVEGGVTRLTFPADRADQAVVAGRARAHLRIRFSGFYAGEPPAQVPEGSLVQSVTPIPVASGCAFEIAVAPAAAGYRIDSDIANHRVVLSFERTASSALEPFAPESPPGPRSLHVVVLDPGHGGADLGVSEGGMVEKNLTLALARLIRADLEHRLKVRVVLTREDDRALSEDQRAELANRSHADLVIALHFDGCQGGQTGGATAYCPPATFAQREEHAQGAIALLPWRDVALRHAVAARELSEDLLSALELRGLGPTRLREILPYPLLGVNAPGLLLECATLTSPDDRARLAQPHGLEDLATTLSDGILTWQRNP